MTVKTSLIVTRSSPPVIVVAWNPAALGFVGISGAGVVDGACATTAFGAVEGAGVAAATLFTLEASVEEFTGTITIPPPDIVLGAAPELGVLEPGVATDAVEDGATDVLVGEGPS